MAACPSIDTTLKTLPVSSTQLTEAFCMAEARAGAVDTRSQGRSALRGATARQFGGAAPTLSMVCAMTKKLAKN